VTARSATSGSAGKGVPVSPGRRGYVLMAGILLVMMLGGTLPIPLYVIYEKQLVFGSLGVTVVFAAYVVGTLFALVALGDLSDHVGRRKVLAIGVACAALSTVLFLVASGIGLLIVARIVSGLAAGFVTGTATAALAELQPRGDRQAAAVVASGSNQAGLGLGPLIAGIFAEYVAMPTRSVFWAYLGICALALAAVAVIPETVRNPDKVISLRPHLGVPPPMRAVMLGACLGIFAAFSVLGFFSSLVPEFLHGTLGVHNLALIGATVFLIFITSAISQAASARLPARRSLTAGGGVAVGFIFRGGLSELNRLAEPRHRAAVVSTFFAAAYLGLGLVPVLTGLIGQLAGPVGATVCTSALAAALVLVALIVVLRSFGTKRPAEPRSTPSDSWCCPAEQAGQGALCGSAP
jgi:MFS family permease